MTLEIDSELIRAHREWLDKIRAEAFEQGKKFGWQKGHKHGYKQGLIYGRRGGHIAAAWDMLRLLSEEEQERIRAAWKEQLLDEKTKE